MADKVMGESTFWYFLCHQTWHQVSVQINQLVEAMNRRAREVNAPLVCKIDLAISWATVCRLYLFSIMHAPDMSK